MALSYARYSKMFSLIQEGLTFFPHTSNNFTIIPHSSPLDYNRKPPRAKRGLSTTFS
jgi:hypothetical protein